MRSTDLWECLQTELVNIGLQVCICSEDCTWHADWEPMESEITFGYLPNESYLSWSQTHGFFWHNKEIICTFVPVLSKRLFRQNRLLSCVLRPLFCSSPFNCSSSYLLCVHSFRSSLHKLSSLFK